MLNITFGAIGAGAATRYESGSTKMMRLLAAPARLRKTGNRLHLISVVDPELLVVFAMNPDQSFLAQNLLKVKQDPDFRKVGNGSTTPMIT
jgi:hypothetical protein